MNSVIVGELICALWNQWQTQRQSHVNTLSHHTEQQKPKAFEDHDSSNLSISVPSRTFTSNLPDDRYILLSPRSQQL